MFVHVYTDIGKSRPVILKAKVIQKSGNNYTIKYLSPTCERYNGKTLFKYESETYTIDEESITEYIDDDDEECIGYTKGPSHDVFVEHSDLSDPEYDPSDSDQRSSEYDESDSESGSETDEYDDPDEDHYEDYEDDPDDNIFRD